MSTSSKYGFPLPLLWEWDRYCTDLAGRNWKEKSNRVDKLNGVGFFVVVFLPAFCFLSESGFAGPSFM